MMTSSCESCTRNMLMIRGNGYFLGNELIEKKKWSYWTSRENCLELSRTGLAAKIVEFSF